MGPALTLAEMQRIRQWHVEHRREHPLECQLWDAVLALWLMGWVGWLAVLVLELLILTPLCLVGSCLPRAYVAWRARAHARQRLRCDWLGPQT